MAQQTSSGLKVTLPSDTEIAMTRVFDAPRELVFKAHSSAEHMKHWFGPRQYEIPVCEVDFRAGGKWRMVHRAPDGGEHTFSGEYREIVPPERIAWTFEWEGYVSNEAMTLEENDGKTTLTSRSTYDSKDARDAMMQGDSMEQGTAETYERLDEYLAELAKS
jgi:uncharacterized protein YndB with AHSA1/START domain